jgi:hypothetical protein
MQYFTNAFSPASFHIYRHLRNLVLIAANILTSTDNHVALVCLCMQLGPGHKDLFHIMPVLLHTMPVFAAWTWPQGLTSHHAPAPDKGVKEATCFISSLAIPNADY